MPAPNDALRDRLSRSREINITVTGRKSGRAISIPVWFVLEDDTLYLLPVQGSDTQWYKNVLKNPSIRIKAGGAEAEVRRSCQGRHKGEVCGREIPRQVRDQRREEVLFKIRCCRSRSRALTLRPQSAGSRFVLKGEKGASSRRPRVENLAPSRFVPSFRIYLASLPLVAGSCYFSISDDQFKMTDNGAELDVSTFVLTKNFCPSGVTS